MNPFAVATGVEKVGVRAALVTTGITSLTILADFAS